MTAIDSLIENEEVQKVYKGETGKNAKWGGKFTQVFKDWIKENKEDLNELTPHDEVVEVGKKKGVKLKVTKIEKLKKPTHKVGDIIVRDESLELAGKLELKGVKIVEEDEEEELEDFEDSFDDTLDGEAAEILKMEKEMVRGVKIAKAKKSKEKVSHDEELEKGTPLDKTLEKKGVKIKSKEKKKVVLSGVSKKKMRPTIFTSKFDETWIPLIKQGRKEKSKGVKRKKGVIIIISGQTGSGKTHLAIDMINVPEIELTYRIIPRGEPIYLIMTDPSPEDEIDRNFRKHKWINIFPINCYVEDPKTGLLDPIATLKKINEFLSGLKERENGTVIIEDWTVYCALILYSYMTSSGGSKGAGIKFDDFLRPEKPINPTEYQYKARLIDQILLSFQNSFMLNFILVANLKDKWVSTGKSVYDAEKTGEQIEDMQKGSDRKADVVVRMWKEEVGERIIRKLIFKKSRFEGEVVIANQQVIVSPTAKSLMKKIVELYLKGK